MIIDGVIYGFGIVSSKKFAKNKVGNVFVWVLENYVVRRVCFFFWLGRVE